MEQVWRTSDGSIYDFYGAAALHENPDKVKMFTREGAETLDSNEAITVILVDRESAKIFMDICENEGSGCNGITEEDRGIFAWNDWERQYDYIDNDMANALLAALSWAERNTPKLFYPAGSPKSTQDKQ